jgi:hypothetical protein
MSLTASLSTANVSRYEHSCHLGEKIAEASVVIIKNYPLHHIGGVAESGALKQLKQSKV